MVSSVASKGYADVTIADVVAAAGVSKRTFYEHFTSKQDCLLACCREAHGLLQAELGVLLAQDTTDPREHVTKVLQAWLSFLDRAPELARTMLTELQTAGVEGRRLRREANLQVARLLQDAVSAAPGSATLDLEQAIALIGGFNEVVVMHAEGRPGEPFSVLGPGLVRFASAVLLGSSRGVAARSPEAH